jgi:hypothetical protein
VKSISGPKSAEQRKRANTNTEKICEEAERITRTRETLLENDERRRRERREGRGRGGRGGRGGGRGGAEHEKDANRWFPSQGTNEEMHSERRR